MAGHAEGALAPPVALRPLSTNAVASVVLFVAGLILPLLLNIVGMVCAILGVRKTGPEGPRRGRGIAVVGAVLNALALVFFGYLIYVVVYVGMIKGEL